MRKICNKNNKHLDCTDHEMCRGCIEKYNFTLLDDALAPLIPILWDKGYVTTDSCSGHISVYQKPTTRGDTYIRFNANLCNVNKIIDATKLALSDLNPTHFII